MKKSIKYAGIAAATLLAVAPVAAPVVSTTTTAQAAEVNGKVSDADALTAALDKFDGKFGGSREARTAYKNANIDGVKFNQTGATYGEFIKTATAFWLADADSEATPAEDGSNAVKVDDKIANATGDEFTADSILSQTDVASDKDVPAANVRNIVVSAKETLSNGTVADVLTNENLKQGLTDASVKDVTVTVTYDYTDTEGKKQSGETELVLKNTLNALSQVNVDYTTPYNVALNQTVTDSRLVSGTDLKITDQNGKSLLTSYAVPSRDFFDSARGAAKNMASATVSGDVVETSDYNTKGQKTATFKKAGTWYQSLTVNFGADSALSHYLETAMTNSQQNPLVINGVTFGSINTDTFDFIKDANGNITGMRFARAINVSSDSSQWTTVENKGVVTTKTAKEYYTLIGNDGSQIKNRALSAGTPWITDQKRTDQNGNVQYRVATGEWIDANDVTFSDKTDNGEGAYTGVTAINGKVTLDGPNSFVYFLYDDNGVQLKNRAVNGDSAWYTDKKATNADGTTVYRVATGEWLQAGSGAHYSAY